MTEDLGELSASLEAALLRELRAEYERLAAMFFESKLEPPQLTLVRARARLGRWVESTRTIELSKPLLLTQPWGVVVEVLKHEMAHQWVSEILGEREETAHGPTFRALCERLGIDGAASGLPSPAVADEDRVVARIAKLLALAESPNVHEAEAATAAAQKLLLKHNLERSQARERRGYTWRHLGKPTGRTTEAERVLSLLLARHFFVEAIWVPVYRPREGKRGSVLEICGTRENVDIAEYVHGFLVETAARLWQEHKAARGLRGDRDRRTFLAGVMTGMNDKLARQARSHAEAGLVWLGDAELRGFYRRRHPHVRQVRYAGQRRSEAYAEGRAAGAKIVLRRGMRAGETEARGRLLGPASRR